MIIAKEPIKYNGTGSAVDNYFSDKPVDASSEPAKPNNWGLFDKNNSKHRAVLSLLRQAQWTIPHPRHGEVADLIRFSDWLKSDKSPVNKPLLEMCNKNELPKIIKALEGIINSIFK